MLTEPTQSYSSTGTSLNDSARWGRYLSKIAFDYNTSVNTTTSLTPFEIVYGKDQNYKEINVPMLRTLDINANARKLQTELIACYDTVARNSESKVIKHKLYADCNIRPAEYVVGDRVYILKQGHKKGISKVKIELN